MTVVRLGRVLGVDLGSRRVGLALSDPSRVIASPHAVVARGVSHDDLIRVVTPVVREYEVTLVVVGLPLSLSGRDGPAARAARAVVDAMQGRFGDEIPVVLHDERLTTITAQRSLREAGVRGRAHTSVVDKVAAAVMLQAYLDGSMPR